MWENKFLIWIAYFNAEDFMDTIAIHLFFHKCIREQKKKENISDI